MRNVYSSTAILPKCSAIMYLCWTSHKPIRAALSVHSHVSCKPMQGLTHARLPRFSIESLLLRCSPSLSNTHEKKAFNLCAQVRTKGQFYLPLVGQVVHIYRCNTLHRSVRREWPMSIVFCCMLLPLLLSLHVHCSLCIGLKYCGLLFH